MRIRIVPLSPERFDAVIDGVLQQWLHHQRRHLEVERQISHVPFDVQTFAKTQLFEVEILPTQSHLVSQRDQFAMVAHQRAKKFGQLLKRRLGTPRIKTNQRDDWHSGC
jgi:hypothetical protein